MNRNWSVLVLRGSEVVRTVKRLARHEAVAYAAAVTTMGGVAYPISAATCAAKAKSRSR